METLQQICYTGSESIGNPLANLLYGIRGYFLHPCGKFLRGYLQLLQKAHMYLSQVCQYPLILCQIVLVTLQSIDGDICKRTAQVTRKRATFLQHHLRKHTLHKIKIKEATDSFKNHHRNIFLQGSIHLKHFQLISNSASPLHRAAQTHFSSVTRRKGDPLLIGKQEVKTYSCLYGEYVDPQSAVIFISSQRQCLYSRENNHDWSKINSPDLLF